MLNRFCRILGTGFCFSLFGLGGLFILCLVFPLLRFCYSSLASSQAMAREIIHFSFRFFVGVMVLCGTISYEVRHQEKLNRRGLLVIANHPSLIDVVLLIALTRHSTCVVKNSLRDNPFTRGPVRSAGFIANSEGPGLIDDCIASLRAGDNLIIFPEGTRTLEHKGALNPFMRGAANIALRGNLDITPVVIRVSEPMLGKGQRWYHAPKKKPHFILSVEDDISIAHYRAKMGADIDDSKRNLTSRKLSCDLRGFFMRQINIQD